MNKKHKSCLYGHSCVFVIVRIMEKFACFYETKKSIISRPFVNNYKKINGSAENVL